MLKALQVKKSFDGVGVLAGITIEVQKGEVVALIGPSGSGKSTFLRCVNRLERIDSGEISLDGDRMCWMEGNRLREADERTLASIRRRMGMVFQSFNLFPHMNVLRNLTDAPISVLKLPRKEAEDR
ncbi:MAG TPA: ATP-binding cassette domain-containing protein, partial [Clostridia bacterium]|nr:ATP-binding cassette domain-containing protein [Clostridia bacterium]